MKKIIIILVTFFVCYAAQAQKDFQGEIIYALHGSMSSKKEAELKITFGIHKIKLRFKEGSEYDKDEMIVIPDSGASFIVNREKKTFQKKLLSTVSKEKALTKKTYSGYSASPVLMNNNGLSNFFSGYMKGSSFIFYVADSLYYTIAPGFDSNTELVAIQKGKIVLGAEIEFANSDYGGSDTAIKIKDIITIEAINIKPRTINEDEFAIPNDYVDSKLINNEPAANTSYDAGVTADTTVVTYPKKKQPAKKPARPVKSKTAVKSSAIKKKDQ